MGSKQLNMFLKCTHTLDWANEQAEHMEKLCGVSLLSKPNSKVMICSLQSCANGAIKIIMTTCT